MALSNLQTRVLTASVLIPILAVCLAYGRWALVVLLTPVFAIGVYEFYTMAQAKGVQPLVVAGAAFVAAFPATVVLGGGSAMTALLALACVTLAAARLARPVEGGIVDIAVTLAGVLFIGWLPSHLLLLRQTTDPGTWMGLYLCVLALATTFIADSGAYFAGRWWGKAKMAANISPGKTWAGFAGEMVTGVLGALAVYAVFTAVVFPVAFPLWATAALGLMIAVAAVVGDLVESLAKRDSGMKDSGAVIPGHGGVYDRLDSLIYTVPATYYAARFVVPQVFQ